MQGLGDFPPAPALGAERGDGLEIYIAAGTTHGLAAAGVASGLHPGQVGAPGRGSAPAGTPPSTSSSASRSERPRMSRAKCGVSPFIMYHPEVITVNPGFFNSSWRAFWGIQ